MKLSQLLNGIEYITDCDLSLQIDELTVDSRKAAEGVLFCCFVGITRDAHDFAPSAAAAGAVCLVERDLGIKNQILVKNTREAFGAVCENWFGNPLERLKLIGITGTNGKTSTTYIFKHILEKLGYRVGLIGTIQNMVCDEVYETHFTTPDTYELHELFAKMVEAGCSYCVMEVSSFGLEQGRVAGLEFELGCFTNLSQDHLDVHGSMEAYFKAKCILFEHCKYALVNTDDEWGAKISPAVAELFDYGERGDKFLKGENIECHPDGVSFDAVCGGERVRVDFQIPGRFSVYNALLAMGCAIIVERSNEKKTSLDEIAGALSTARGIKGRAEVFPTGRDFTIILDYAHSPDGIENILSSMREVCRGRLGILFGCGGDRDSAKRPIMGEIASRLADYVIVTSDNPRSESPAAIIEQIIPGVKQHDTPYVAIENRRKAMEYAVRHAQKSDVIVFAGKGHETYQILSSGTIHFDEREVLAEIFGQLDAE